VCGLSPLQEAGIYSTDLSLIQRTNFGKVDSGVAYRSLHKVEKARRDFEEAIRIDPGFKQAKRNLDALRSAP